MRRNDIRTTTELNEVFIAISKNKRKFFKSDGFGFFFFCTVIQTIRSHFTAVTYTDRENIGALSTIESAERFGIQSPCIRTNTIRWTRSPTTGPIHVSSGQAKLFYFNRVVTSRGRFEYSGNRRLPTRYFPITSYKNIYRRGLRERKYSKIHLVLRKTIK